VSLRRLVDVLRAWLRRLFGREPRRQSIELPPPAPAPPRAGRRPGPGRRDSRPSPQAPDAPEPPRFLNLAVLPDGAVTAVPRTRPLLAASRYVLRINVGRLAFDSIVDAAQAHPFPIEHLPEQEDGHWLQVAAFSSELEVPDGVAALFLPRRGDSWCCDCAPGGSHGCTPAERSPHVRIPVVTAPHAGAAFARVALYYENNLVQSVLVSADVVERAGETGAHHARVDFTLSEDLADLDAFEPRLLNILTNETGGTHRVVFKDGERPFDFTFGEGALTRAMEDVRRLLLDIHVDQVGNSRENRLRAGNSKPPAEFVDDLARLAKDGYGRWQSLFLQSGDPLREVGAGAAGTIQVARVPLTSFVFPWAALYDLPLDLFETELEPCEVIRSWDGRGAMLDGAPGRCPYEHAHAPKNTLCPFGFWGVRYAIEHPTGSGALVREVGRVDPRVLVAALSRDLDRRETDRHFGELVRILSALELRSADTRADVAAALGEPAPALVYFYCHGGTGADGGPCLIVGDDEDIPAGQILTWHLSDWPAGHWQRTRPLVLLNGCHTAELTPMTPVNFVDAFAGASAGGVIGTEITLDQAMAGEAAEFLLHELASQPVNVGEAVRRLRLHFISKGNLLGLAYTAYCAAELRVPLAA
jgi:hypothetical protein